MEINTLHSENKSCPSYISIDSIQTRAADLSHWSTCTWTLDCETNCLVDTGYANSLPETWLDS